MSAKRTPTKHDLERTPMGFEPAVKATFERMLSLTNLKLNRNKYSDSAYEIPGPKHSLCVRWCPPRDWGVLVTFTPDSRFTAFISSIVEEIGLAIVVEFYGDPDLAREIIAKTNRCETTDQALLEVLNLCASAVEKHCIPLLLGLKDDWPEIEKFVAEKCERQKYKRQ